MIYQSLKEHVYNYISDEIKNKNLDANEKINEQEICNKLGVSRTPVREALIQLSSDGLLEITPRRGFRVKSLTMKEAQDLYAVISNLDVMAAEIALQKLSEEDLTKMQILVDQMDDAILRYEFGDYYKLQMDFHNIYILRTDNRPLIDTIFRLKKRFIRQSYPNEKSNCVRDILLNTNQEHREILNCFKEKNLDKLKKDLQQHWNLNYAEMDSLDEKKIYQE
ncbi:MAG: GntR family transcriptional regulator [Filifactor alocis]|nr:GntR family transcriptional regulator [Filifactor alocis]